MTYISWLSSQTINAMFFFDTVVFVVIVRKDLCIGNA